MAENKKIVSDEEIRTRHIPRANVQTSQMNAVENIYTQMMEITDDKSLANATSGYLARLVIRTLLQGEQNITRDDIINELDCDKYVAMSILSTYSVLVAEIMGTRAACMKRGTTRGNKTNHPKRVAKPLDITTDDEDEFLKGVGLF